ncbi:MAG: tripartite tricarboxylate transporter TctB family protein [Boseongicola sp. SB0677_bin_26]|nr:tripartite tricarboxylate transporter TctB family protein [Boseongicola sp. SB0665_bin_10]MYG27094.1 tripartite tricarboxylate transporter TctB family protein [Boseongicola sp. SB0677_bin_26]
MTQHREESIHRPGVLIFITLFVLFAIFLLSQLAAETRLVPNAKLAEQPRFWPAIGVLSMVGFGLAQIALSWRVKTGWDPGEVAVWLRAFEYLAWFMAYVAVVPVMGYLAATVAFTTSLAFRQGYRDARSLGAAALLGLTIVLVFKTGLSVKIPGGAVYEYLPGPLRSFMIVNF